MMVAAALGRGSAVEVLLERGANPELRDRSGQAALERARESEDERTIRLLESALAHRTPAGTDKARSKS